MRKDDPSLRQQKYSDSFINLCKSGKVNNWKQVGMVNSGNDAFEEVEEDIQE